ncbi:hypothetical protein [Pseudalkalibacillus berkeleyi]|uniref:Uncharacterized protein n=1 Tax=Pseudalkalibacillus berkeleyi TaxID=1069813 RepID=A0ABS9GYY4_9BACL|nr:hypothetical protein [Pseudalkalibacillus berkeleyi]MCF6136905.1 hypothetical protein [Pseudalkalibacillus berkeleyi]
MGYVPPYLADQKRIYASRTQETYSPYKLQLHPVERIHFENATEKNMENDRYNQEYEDSKAFRKIYSDLTGKGQNINESI